MPAPLVTVVLPCLDEAAAVGDCVREARDAMERAGWQGEVVVVDNGSTDGSVEVAEAAGARVVREPNAGYGNALRAGFAAASGTIIVMADADATYPLDQLARLVHPVLHGDADIACGGRLKSATRRTMPILHRRVGTPALTFLTRRACGGLAVKDSQTGFRAFRADALPRLDLRSGGMELASEMLVKASHAGLRIAEIETGYRPRVGKSKLNTFSDGWRHVRSLLLLAPDLLLVWPGMVLAALGVVLTLASFLVPQGLAVGSLRWQPVFLSSIALVLGCQGLLAGTVLANRSAVVARHVRRRYAFVTSARFLRRCSVAGALGAAAGLTIDLVLFVNWVSGEPAPSVGLALASMAQSLIVVGATLCSFGVIGRLLSGGRVVTVVLPAPRASDIPGDVTTDVPDQPGPADLPAGAQTRKTTTASFS